MANANTVVANNVVGRPKALLPPKAARQLPYILCAVPVTLPRPALSMVTSRRDQSPDKFARLVRYGPNNDEGASVIAVPWLVDLVVQAAVAYLFPRRLWRVDHRLMEVRRGHARVDPLRRPGASLTVAVRQDRPVSAVAEGVPAVVVLTVCRP